MGRTQLLVSMSGLTSTQYVLSVSAHVNTNARNLQATARAQQATELEAALERSRQQMGQQVSSKDATVGALQAQLEQERRKLALKESELADAASAHARQVEALQRRLEEQDRLSQEQEARLRQQVRCGLRGAAFCGLWGGLLGRRTMYDKHGCQLMTDGVCRERHVL